MTVIHFEANDQDSTLQAMENAQNLAASKKTMKGQHKENFARFF
jgi:hypothetical protein